MVNRAALIAAAAAVLAGCGGDPEPPPPPPRLPADVARSLAARSDAVAAALAAADTCRAQDEAQRLQAETIEAVQRRQIPAAFQEHLSSAVNDLIARIECVPPPEGEEKDEDEGDRGKGKGKGKDEGDGNGKGKGKGKDGDD